MSKRGRKNGSHLLVSSCWLHYFALGNKSGGFCEAVNCERSEQEGKFLFAYLMVPILWFHHLLRPHGTMQGKAWRAVVPFIINITMEINFLSKVYYKRLLNRLYDITCDPL